MQLNALSSVTRYIRTFVAWSCPGDKLIMKMRPMALPRSGLVCASIFVCSLSLFSQQTRIGGPDSLVYLGQRFAKAYGVKFSHAQLVVRGGSAASNPAELEILQSEGSAPKEKSVAFPIAVHAIVLYVNKASPI